MNIEPKSGREIAVWFNDDSCWAYKGTLPVVMQVENLLDPMTPKVNVYVVERCPACVRHKYDHKRIMRWLILPP